VTPDGNEFLRVSSSQVHVMLDSAFSV